MSTPDKNRNSDERPEVDEETRERSAEQRDITAPTPADVRAKSRDGDEEEDAPAPPAADVQAP